MSVMVLEEEKRERIWGEYFCDREPDMEETFTRRPLGRRRERRVVVARRVPW